MQLEDRVAIITGGGRGIGRAIAAAYAREGACVVLAARTFSEVETTADFIRQAGGRALAVPADVSEQADVNSLVTATTAEFGRIDILVNNAGIYGPIGALVDLDPTAWMKSIEINLGGPFLCSHAVLPTMIQQQSGKIINLSGGGATSSRPNFTAYSVAKTGLVRLTEILADEVRPYNIQVNAIAPGGVDTRLLDAVILADTSAGPKALEEARSLKSGKGTPLEEVVGLALLLASDACNSLTGRLISVAWDDWRSIPSRVASVMASDAYTLRRVVPEVQD